MVRHDRPLAEPIIRREPRFLDRDKVALGAIMNQLGSRAEELTHPDDDEESSFSFATTPALTKDPKKVIQLAGGSSTMNMNPDRELATDVDSVALRGMLQRVLKTPVEKYEFPMTTSQELGWMPPRRKGREDKRFRFGLKNSEVTKFAGLKALGEM